MKDSSVQDYKIINIKTMNYQTKCHCCGHIKVAYVSYLSKQLVRALRKLVDYYDDTKKYCNLQKDIELTKNQLSCTIKRS